MRFWLAKTRAIAEDMARQPTSMKVALFALPSVAIVAVIAAILAGSYSQQGVPAPQERSHTSHRLRLSSTGSDPVKPAPVVAAAAAPPSAQPVAVDPTRTPKPPRHHLRHQKRVVRPAPTQPTPAAKPPSTPPPTPVALHHTPHPRHLDPKQQGPGNEAQPKHDGSGDQTGSTGDQGSTGDGGSDSGSTGDWGSGGGD